MSNIHYTGLTDLTWSPCGHILVVSSSDGFCSIVTFTPGELGEELKQEGQVEQQEALPSSQQEALPSTKQESLPSTKQAQPPSCSPVLSSCTPAASPAQVDCASPAQVRPFLIPIDYKLLFPTQPTKGPKRLAFTTLSSPKAERKGRKDQEPKEGKKQEASLVLEESTAQGEDEPGVEPMDTGIQHLSLVLEESQAEAPAPAPAPPASAPPASASVPAPPAGHKKRAPLTTLANSLVAKPSTPEKKGRRVSLITLSSPKAK